MKRLFTVLFAALASSCASELPAERQFDLVCKGNLIERGYHEGSPRREFQTTLQVDLNDGSFCIDACEDQYKLTRWDTSELHYAFDEDKEIAREDDFMTLSYVDDFTMTLWSMKFERHHVYVTCARCTVATRHDTISAGTCHIAPFSKFEGKPDSD